MDVNRQNYFPKYSVFNIKEKEVTHKWIKSNINYDEEKKGHPHSFQKNVSFYNSRLFPWQHMNPQFQRAYRAAILDEDMKADLEDCGALNWCREFVKLEPVAVSNGNCLLHAASVAVWSVEDCHCTLRELLLLAVAVNKKNSFKQRWWRQRLIDLHALKSDTKLVDQEWEAVLHSISSLDTSQRPRTFLHKFLESIHIYVLSNILRRPIIIVADSVARSVTGHSLQDNHIAGIYLPLEWKPIKCGKMPIIIGFSQSHFCPLMSLEVLAPNTEQPQLFPLVTRDYSSLPVRFLADHEEAIASELVQRYFQVQEVKIPQQGGGGSNSPISVPCALFQSQVLPAEHNHILRHFQACEQMALTMSFPVAMATLQDQEGALLRQQMQQRSQTYVVPVNGIAHNVHGVSHQGSQGQHLTIGGFGGDTTMSQSPFLKTSDLEITTSPAVGVRRNMRASPSTTRLKCIIADCQGNGVASQGNLCNSCFRNYTIAEAGAQLISVANELERKTYTLKQNTTTLRQAWPTLKLSDLEKTSQQQRTGVAELTSLAPSSSTFALSMMNERCKTGCGYRCSKYTYPYCHECVALVRPPPVESVGLARTATESNNTNIGDLMVFSPVPSAQPLGSVSNRSSASTETEQDQNNLSPTNLHNSTLTLENLHPPKAVSFESLAATQNERLHRTNTLEDRVQEVQQGRNSSGASAEATMRLRDLLPLTAMAENAYKTHGEIVHVSASKCASPFCEVSVFPPEKLCQTCQNVLRRAQEEGGMKIQALQTPQKVNNNKSLPRHQEMNSTSLPRHPQLSNKSLPRHHEMNIPPSIVNQVANLQASQRHEVVNTPPSHQSLNASPVPAHQAVNVQRSPKLVDTIMQQSQGHCSTGQLCVSSRESGRGSQQKRGENCITQDCVNFGDPAHAYMCSKCYADSQQKYEKLVRHYERQASSSGSPRKANSGSPQKTQQQHHQSELRALPRRSSPPGVAALPETSFVSTYGGRGHNSTHLCLQDLASSEPARFTMEYDKLEASTKAGAIRCPLQSCGNYGNRSNGGFCNSCFSVIKEQRIRERIAKYGETVPDGLTTSRQNSV